MTNYVTTTDLSRGDFTVNGVDGVCIKVDPRASNILSRSDAGVLALVPDNLDTGWRKITSTNLKNGFIVVRRINNTVYLSLRGGAWDTVEVKAWNERLILANMPNGFQAPIPTLSICTKDGKQPIGYFVYTGSNDANIIEIKGYDINTSPKDLLRVGMISYPTDQPFPTNVSLPTV